MRTGLIAKKLGMTRMFADNGEHVAVTVLHLDGCQVVGQKTQDKHGYTALQLGAGSVKVKNVSKSERGHFAKSKLEPKAKVAEFRVPAESLVEVGAEFSAEHFVIGQFVDVVGTSIGRGFQGPMKRHNFAGLKATHGVSIRHRSHGSTGQRQDPGRVFKNKRMAGHMGDVRVTKQNLKVIALDAEQGLLMINGSIPGHEGSYVLVKDSVKRALPKEAPKPAGLKQAANKNQAAPADKPAEAAAPAAATAEAPQA